MGPNRKSRRANFGSKTSFTRSENSGFLPHKYSHFSPSIQCKSCKSDYMRFAIEGYCQRCLQRFEHVNREHPGVGTPKNGGQLR